MKHISPIRYLFTFAVFLGFGELMILAGRAAAPTTVVIPILAGALLTIAQISLWEWMVHGVMYHRRLPGLRFITDIHHAGHHFALFPPERYVQKGEFEFMRVRRPFTPFKMSDNALDNFLSEWGQIALHFVVGIPFILVPVWFLGGGMNALFLSTSATLAIISWLLAYVHGVIHTPGDRMIEGQRWFQWLDRHHYIHHIDKSANINFLLPLCDIVIGTQKWALTPEEAAANPSFEEAKPMAKDIARGSVVAEAA